MTTRDLVLSSEYLPILEQSHTAKSLISGQILLMALQASSVSLVRMCLEEPLGHSFRLYMTILNLLSTWYVLLRLVLPEACKRLAWGLTGLLDTVMGLAEWSVSLKASAYNALLLVDG